MDISKIAREIEQAQKASRFLDSKIAQAVGWSSRYREQGPNEKPELLWFKPGSSKPSKFPNYTSSINDAYVLLLELAPQAAVACSWEDGSARAQIDGEPSRVGATPAIAVCVAALYHRSAEHLSSVD
jgi:hypothetical protein